MNELFVNIKVDREERPEFRDVLTSAANAYTTQADRLQANIAQLKHGLEKLARPEGGGA